MSQGFPQVPSTQEIRERTYTAFGHTPCLWQIQVVQALLNSDKDVMSIAPTGAGKTLTFWMPLLFRPTGIQIVIAPLNALGTQNMQQLKGLDISAIAIRAETATGKNLKDIEDGRYRAVLVNPNEAMKEGGGFGRLWKNELLTAQIISIVWDEGHCVSIWKSFRPEYREAGRLRYLIPRTIPFLVTSATLSESVCNDVIETLQMRRDKTLLIRRSNDRPNVYLTVHKITHSLDSFEDLAFLIPGNWQPGDHIPKFLVFFDNIQESVRATSFLRSWLPPEYQNLVRWYNADMSSAFRACATTDFTEGKVCGLICTDAFGLGVDIADIEIVVQWRATCDMDALWQRIGRAARRPGMTALAIFLVEGKYFDDEKLKKTQICTAGGITHREPQALQSSEAKRWVIFIWPSCTMSDRASELMAIHDHEQAAKDILEGPRNKGVEQQVDEPLGIGTHSDSRMDCWDLKVISRDRDVQIATLKALYHKTDKAGELNQHWHMRKKLEISPVMDDMVNAKTRPFRCYRLPVMAYYGNDGIGAWCVLVNSPICCKLTSRASRLNKDYTINQAETGLCNALHRFRNECTTDQYGLAYAKNMGTGSVMSDEVLQRIVDCAHAQNIKTIEDLQRETKWCRTRDYGGTILALINR
ncbi:P-loop containing nucleoside triphosphate hydrolase protein [Sparassis latifolia]